MDIQILPDLPLRAELRKRRKQNFFAEVKEKEGWGGQKS